jgi:zinc protease
MFFSYMRLYLMLSYIIFISSCASIQKLSSDNDLTLAPAINAKTLPNGLSYYYMHSKQPANRCFVRLNVKVGSFAEKDNQLGIAHLLEHMAFEDRAISQKDSLAEWFQQHGMSFGPDANAYTSVDRTVYKIDLPNCEEKTLSDALNIIRNFADKLDFSEESLLKEQIIVDKEQLETKNSQSLTSQKIINNLYSGTLYPKRPVLGKSETRKLFNINMLKDFYNTWYTPKNLSVVVVGDYKNNPEALIKNIFSDLRSPEKNYIQPEAGALDHKTPVFIIYEKEIPVVELIYSVQNKKITKPKFNHKLLKDRIAFDLALFMLKKSYAKQALIDPKLVRENSLNGFMLDHDSYELSLSVVGDVASFGQNFLDAFAILRQAAEQGFDAAEFTSIKSTYQDFLAQSVVQESTWGSDNWTNLILEHINKQNFAYSAHDFDGWAQPILASLTPQDCQRNLQKALASGYDFIFALGPLEQTPEHIRLLQNLLKKAQTRSIELATPQAPINFAYHVPTCPVLPVAPRKYLPNLGAYSIRINNNLNVLVKPTKFKSDEIFIAASTNEGFLSMNPSDLSQAHVAQSALPEGGLAKHQPQEIISLLETKFMRMNMAIFADRIQATIQTREQDLRFALELLRASIVEPLYAESALTRVREKIKLNDEELKHDMWAPLQLDFPKALTRQDHRVGREKLDSLLAVSRDDLLTWHKKYISSRPLNIVVVGDVDINDVMNNIACVLGPVVINNNHKNTHVSSKLAFDSGIHKIYNIDTSNEASKVVLRYPLMFPSGSYYDHRLPIIQNLIQESLRLKLREKKHATYSPTATVVSSPNAKVQNWLDVVISAPKDEADAILQEAKKIINNLAQKGITAHQLAKAKQPYLTQVSNNANDNNYWLLLLTQNFNRTLKLPNQKKITADIKAINAAAINQVLRRYMRAHQASSAIVHGK